MFTIDPARVDRWFAIVDAAWSAHTERCDECAGRKKGSIAAMRNALKDTRQWCPRGSLILKQRGLLVSASKGRLK